MASAIEKIQEEHRDYGRVLRCLQKSVKDLKGKEWRRQAGQGKEGKPGYRPNLDLLFSIVYYIRVFPEKFHHPKEEDHLFKALRIREANCGALLDRIGEQHEAGAAKINRLDAALKDYQSNYPDGLEALEAAAESFATSQYEHMRLEEEEILPAAKAALTEEDWREIDQAFAANADPMFGENLELAFHTLHDHIVKGTESAA